MVFTGFTPLFLARESNEQREFSICVCMDEERTEIGCRNAASAAAVRRHACGEKEALAAEAGGP